jgi:hypothetical protein
MQSTWSLNAASVPRALARIAAMVLGVLAINVAVGQERPVDYQRDIRPILSNACFACHGPDESHREAGLRLDERDAAITDLGSGAAIVPGNLDASAMVSRILSDDPDLRMPPPDSGKELTAAQIELLKAWIAQGAPYAAHWAFAAPQRPLVPTPSDASWVRNPIDAFVLDRLHAEGLQPSPPAPATTLARRLSLDLTGLPPTPSDVDEILASPDDRRFAKAIDAMIGSVHFGERWGRWWLDAARYADSDGFEKDKPRFVWFYRDWVIQSLQRDIPYDQFVIQQIAGDLLPQADQSTRVATGFLRNSMQNEEGGADPEQFRMEAMYDRMDAIGKAVLGLTIQCTQCHTHKYDPIKHTEYYQMLAYINNCDESQATVFTAEQEKVRQEVLTEIAAQEAKVQSTDGQWQQHLEDWVEQQRARRPTTWTTLPLEFDADSLGGQKHLPQADGSYLCQGYAPTLFAPWGTGVCDVDRLYAVRLELLTDDNLPHRGPGRSVDGVATLTEFKLEVASADQPDQWRVLPLAVSTSDASPPDVVIAGPYDDRSGKRRITGRAAYAIDGDETTAWSSDIGAGRRNVDRHLVFQLLDPIENARGMRLRVKLVQRHGGWNSDDNQTQNIGRFRVSLTDRANAIADPIPPAVAAAMQVAKEQRDPSQQQAIFSHWRRTVAEFKPMNDAIEQAWQRYPVGHSQLVLHERDTQRISHRLERGDFLKPAEPVTAGVPAFLHPLPEEGANDRLAFAKWLVDRRSPTTARSIVNRIWQAYFGTGLVATPDDFGLQGDPPSHPELLDWLAVELMDHGWSLKHIHRLIVDSNTYRQSSQVTAELLERDPENRLLARGPRVRVEAEVVRDIALAASGLLNREVGGPPVFPPAPEFLFQPPSSYGPKTWDIEKGANRYRRALYTFRFRSVPYPVLQTFDAPTGDQACVRRVRSNTPLQALVALNEPLFMECARALARSLVEHDGDERSRLEAGFRRTLSRTCTDAEAGVLIGLLNDERKRLEGNLESAWALAAEDPTNPPTLPDGITASELAAWTTVARVILNLDETITKE